LQKIRSLTGKIIRILDVIDGTTLNDEMIQNILAIYFTPELKGELSSLLNKYNTIFDPRQVHIQSLKPGTVILGPYSSGKSHFALFLAFLIGLDVNFTNPRLREEISNIREKCWEILERKENLGYRVKELKDLREGKFLVSFVTLTNYREQSNFLSIIVDAINRTLKSHRISKRIGIELTEKNLSFILETMKSTNPSAFEGYNKITNNEEQFIYIKNYANEHDLRLKLKSHTEIAIELQSIAEENGYKGYLLFFDEFFRYYNPQEKNSKIKIGSILQSFSYEIQNNVKLGILPISQEPIFENDEFLQQVERRFSKVTISYENATSIIHKRLIPEVNLDAIENFFKIHFPNSSEYRKRISLDVFKDYYPFHKKTITDLQKFVGYYANDTKGIINYLWYALKEESFKDADQLITANTLYDYFISDLNSPEMRGYELKEKCEEIKDQYISKIESYIERDLSEKMLKILLFCTNKSMDWSLDDFYNHFYDYSESTIRDLLENLVQYIENHSNFISANISRENFYYNPGGRGDINRYVTIIERAIDESQILDFYWNESMNDLLQNQRIKKEIFEWKKVLCKTYCIIPVNGDLDRIIDETLKMLIELPEKDNIFTYEFDKNFLIDAVFIIDKQKSSNKNIIETKLNSKIKEQKRLSEIDNFEFNIYYIKPLSFLKSEIHKIKNYYARKICLTIFELVSMKKDYNWDQLKNTSSLRRYKGILNDTVMDMNLKTFLSENKETNSRYITDIKVTLSSVEKDESILGLLRDDNINGIFMKSLNKAEMFDTKSWTDYSFYDKNLNTIIKETMETLIPLKYPILDDLIVMDTKKLYGSNLTGILNLLVKHVFIENYEFRITDNKTKQVLTTTFKELDLIEVIKKNDFRFKQRFSIESSTYFNRFNELFKGKKEVEINEIIIEYMKPPYGFPKIVTFLMLLSLVHMQKFIFTLRGKEISSLTDIKNSIGIKTINKKGVNNIIRRGFITKGEILNRIQFKRINLIISTLINYENYRTYKNIQKKSKIVDFDAEPLKRFIEEVIEINLPSLNHQIQLVELINTLQVTTMLSSLKENTINFYEKLKNYLKINANLEDIKLFDYEKLDLGNEIFNLSEFLNEIQGIESSGKIALIELIKIFDDWFNVQDFKDLLAKIFLIIEKMEEKNSDFNLISEDIDFLIKTSSIQDEDWIKSQHQKIIIDITEILTDRFKFMNIVKGELGQEIKIKDSIEKYKEIFINRYKQLHSKFWSIISAYKDNYESSELVLVKTIEKISHLKIKTSYRQEKINHQLKICNNYENLTDQKIIEEIGCSECKFYFNADFDLTIIPGCRYSISVFNLIGAKSSEIISAIDTKLTEFLITQILKILKSFVCEEDKETLGKSIIEKISYELNQGEREMFLECTKTTKDFDYPKARKMFLNKSEIKSEKRSDILLAIEFVYRVGLTLGYKDNNSIIKQAKAINAIFENISFVEFFNDLIEVNLSPLDIIKVKYMIFQLEDLLSFEPRINNLANNQIAELFKKRINDYGKVLIIPHSKYEFINDIYYEIQNHNLNLRVLKLNKTVEERSLSKIDKSQLKKGNECFFAYEQIIIMNQKMQKELQTLIRSIFSNCYYFGELELAREFFYNNSIKYLEIYIDDNNKWTKWGYIQKLFGCIEEYKEK